jgi:hypothetical protein
MTDSPIDMPTGTPETGIDPDDGDDGYTLKDFDHALHEAPDGEHDDCGGEDEMDMPSNRGDEDEDDEENDGEDE